MTVALRIRTQTIISVTCQITTGLLAIFLAYKGYGVWALALQSVSSSFMTTILLWYKAHWCPKFCFSKVSFHYLWGFGSKMLCVGLVSTTFKNIFSVIIGKYFNRNSLGYYAKAQSLSDMFPKMIYSVINKVSLPTLASVSDDKAKLKAMFRCYMQVSAFIVFPIVGLLIVLAKPLIVFLWTDKWLNSVILFQILCLGSLWDPFNLFSLNVMQVLKRPDITLKLEIFNKVSGTLIILATIRYGLIPFICGRAFYNFYEYIVNINCTRIFIGYKLKEQVEDLYSYLLITIIVAFIVSLIMQFLDTPLLQILIGLFTGIVVYLFMSYIFHVDALTYLNQTIQKIKSGKK